MANPSKQDAQMADKQDNPLIGPAQTLVADMVTTAATQTTPFGFSTGAQADSIATRINLIIDVLEEHGLMKAS